MARVAVYGSVNWDEICQLPRYPGPHEKIEALAIDSALGGSAANTATWLAPRVERVDLIGAVGDDREGSLCLDWLRGAGVGYDCVEVLPGAFTSRASSWVVGTDKRIVTLRQPQIRREHAPDYAVSAAGAASHLHLGSMIDGAGLECLERAQAAGATVSIELSGRPHDAARKQADIVFLNTQELRGVFGLEVGELSRETLTRVAPKRGATLVVTEGGTAVHCVAGDTVQRFAVTALDRVVDRTGGGDAFDAGFIAAWLADDRELEAAVEAGIAASTEVLHQVGGSRRPRP